MSNGNARALRLPMVANAAVRNGHVLLQQRRAQTTWNIVAVGAFLAVAYFLAGARAMVLVLAALTGMLGGSAIAALRAFGEHYRLMRFVVESLEENAARVWRMQAKARSRAVALRMIVALLAFLCLAVWIVFSEERWWLLLLCIIALAYALSSLKPLASDPEMFTKHTLTPGEDACRIVLLRSFEERSSSLTRSALVPILAGYGLLDLVVDDTIEQAEALGVFGAQAADLSRLCTVQRLSNTDWRDGVGHLIAGCDVAVIDSTRVSPGVIWEFAQCYECLPSHRVYAVIDTSALADESIKEYMARFYGALAAHPEMPRDVNPRVFLLAEGAWKQEALANDIHQKMLEIVAIEGHTDAIANNSARYEAS